MLSSCSRGRMRTFFCCVPHLKDTGWLHLVSLSLNYKIDSHAQISLKQRREDDPVAYNFDMISLADLSWLLVQWRIQETVKYFILGEPNHHPTFFIKKLQRRICTISKPTRWIRQVLILNTLQLLGRISQKRSLSLCLSLYIQYRLQSTFTHLN